jgi:hypothetical protein
LLLIVNMASATAVLLSWHGIPDVHLSSHTARAAPNLLAHSD